MISNYGNDGGEVFWCVYVYVCLCFCVCMCMCVCLCVFECLCKLIINCVLSGEYDQVCDVIT